MNRETQYKYLEPRRGSNYEQLFVQGRISAEAPYRPIIGPDPRTPDEVAHNYSLPLLRQERDRELEWIKANGLDKPPLVPDNFQPER